MGYQILMDFIKIWHEGSSHKVLWHIFRVFKFRKNLSFIKVFQNYRFFIVFLSVFSNFWGSKTQTFEISRKPFGRACHFTSILVFLCGFLLNSIFGEFLNIEVIFVKIGVK